MGAHDKTFKRTVTYYHGNQLAPHQLKNHRLEPTVTISEMPPGRKMDWDKFYELDKLSKTHQGFFISRRKAHASYFATKWHKKKTGYLYSFKKPKDIRHAFGIEDPDDSSFSTKPIKPSHVQMVTMRGRNTLRLAPSAYNTTDFHYTHKMKFDDALKRSSPYYYRTSRGKRQRVKNSRR